MVTDWPGHVYPHPHQISVTHFCVKSTQLLGFKIHLLLYLFMRVCPSPISSAETSAPAGDAPLGPCPKPPSGREVARRSRDGRRLPHGLKGSDARGGAFQIGRESPVKVYAQCKLMVSRPHAPSACPYGQPAPSRREPKGKNLQSPPQNEICAACGTP